MRRPAVVVALVSLTTGAIVTPASPAAAAASGVVINELHYHPQDDNPAAEFVELLNTSSRAVDVGGWCVDGVGTCIAGGTRISAGGYLVITGDRFGGALSNGGEEIELLDATGQTVDAVEYDDKREWPALADGEGQSLQRRDPAAESDTPGNWEAHPPTPGTRNLAFAPGLLPAFDDVEHTELPGAGQPIEVTADVDDATNATLRYRVDFGPEIAIRMAFDAGAVSATIPGQPAGALVRYRINATRDGLIGRWPRQGDGSRYVGTTVARRVATDLPLFEIFMPDEDFARMSADLSLSGDDGYAMVFAYEGQVFDNARIRVKGQVSRNFPKKKFKIILPAGYDLEDDDLFPDDVDEWGMHSAWADKSFLRETLASEFMTAADARGAQQAFPVRFERNNQFLGLYTYVEQPDGTYRDRYGLDGSQVYEVGPDNLFGLLSPLDPGRSQESLRARYDKETFEYRNDDELRHFIATVNGLRGADERNWIYDNVDVPSVVNILAASMVIQNQDWGHKNYRLVFDEYGRVGIVQNDYDLTFGRRWSNTFGATESRVYVGGAFEHPGGPFFETFFFDPELVQLVRRRIRTLTEEELNPSKMSGRALQLAAQIRPEAVADRAVWGTYGSAADPTDEASRLIDSFVRPQHGRLLGPLAGAGRVAATTQPAIPQVAIESVQYEGIEHVTVRNFSGDSVDLSGFEIRELGFTVPGGTVLLPGRAAIFVHDDVPSLRDAYRGLLVAGVFDESLLDAEGGITLRNRAGDVVSARDLLPPRQLTEIVGQPDRSALVSLVAAETGGPGFLQLVSCDERPGATSNLNVDGPGQTRSVLALARFDSDGETCVFNLGPTHVIVDVQGYLAEDAVDDIDDERLLDTRSGQKPTRRSVTAIEGGRAGATAIVSLVATETEGPGFLAIVPCDVANPGTSNLNWIAAGMTVATLATVEFDDRGRACVFAHDPVHIVADVQGYLADTAFDDVDDERVVDTRTGAKPGDRSMTVVAGRPNSVAVMSLVAAETGGPGFLQVLPCGTEPGASSNVNYGSSGIAVNGLTTVTFDGDGRACVFALTSTHIVADLQGYFADGAFDDIVDVRVADTRTG